MKTIIYLLSALISCCALPAWAHETKTGDCAPANLEQQRDRALQLLKALRTEVARDPSLGLRQDAKVWLDPDQLEVCMTVCERKILPGSEYVPRCSTECLR